jgi:hypothetical protein
MTDDPKDIIRTAFIIWRIGRSVCKATRLVAALTPSPRTKSYHSHYLMQTNIS